MTQPSRSVASPRVVSIADLRAPRPRSSRPSTDKPKSSWTEAFAAAPSPEAQRRLAYFSERRDEIVSTIRELVEIESPSDNKAAVDRVAEAVAHKFSKLGGKVNVRVRPAKDFGNHLQV